MRAALAAVGLVLALAAAGCTGQTAPASQISATAATLNATGACDDLCRFYVRWRPAGAGPWTNGPVRTTSATGPTPQAWSERVAGLRPGTAYEYQACGKEQTWAQFGCVGPGGAGDASERFATPPEPLAWAPPAIDAPSATWDAPATGGYLERPVTVDCRIRLPDVPVTGRVQVEGCHDVVLIGGQVSLVALDPAKETPAVYVQNFTGTAHLEGLLLDGPGMSDGIQVNSDAPGSVAQIENVWVGDLHLTSPDVQHPDAVQTWIGPDVIRVDRVTTTGQQGLTLDSGNERGRDGRTHPSTSIDVRRTNVRLDLSAHPGRQCFAAYRTPAIAPSPTHLEDVFCAHRAGEAWISKLFPLTRDDPSWWGGVREGVPPGGDEVLHEEVGLGYVSPGYG